MDDQDVKDILKKEDLSIEDFSLATMPPYLTPKRECKRKIYFCEKCELYCDTAKDLKQHKKCAHSKEDLRQYNYTHNKVDGTFSCKTCDLELNSKELIEAHVLIHEECFICEVCNNSFYSAYKYSCHMRNHATDRYYSCPLCDYKTLRVTCIAQHINRTHLQKFIYYCGYCGKGFDDVAIFNEHEEMHTGTGSAFVCVVCKKSYAFSRYLLFHQIRYHTVSITGVLRKNQCAKCKKVFSKAASLENHVLRSHGEQSKLPHKKTHLCDSCGKGFASKSKLNIHYRTHTGIKPYSCSYCSKSFTKRDYLVLHERTHTGERPYTCTFCGKCFNQGAALRIHVRSHTGEKPFTCLICNIGYTSKGALTSHLKRCNG